MTGPARSQPRLAAPLLLLAALGVALALAEVAARALLDPPRYHNEPLELDATLGFRGIPGHRRRVADGEGAPFAFVLNRDGFRGAPLPKGPAARGTRRVVFLGDSFLVGAGVAETQLLTRRLGDLLSAGWEGGAAGPVEVLNLSAADYGTGQELLLLRREGPRLAPDLVVLSLYPHNDLVNNYEGLAFRTRVSPGDYVRPYVVPADDGRLEVRYTHPWRAWLRRHSRLFAASERAAVAYGARHDVAWLHPFRRPEPERQRLAEGRAPAEHQEIYRAHPPDSDWERAWQRTARLLRAVRDTTTSLSARLVVLVIPELHQVRRVARDVEHDLVLRSEHGSSLDAYLDWNLPERRLARFFQEEGIEHVLLLPHLRRAVAAGDDVYLRDRHLNARGHEIAAQRLAAALAGPGKTPPPDGRPVRLPAPTVAPARIEPGRPDHWHFHDEGWIPWMPPEDTAGAEGGGALATQQALVVLPARGRELVVRGISAARRHPHEVVLQLVGGPSQTLRIEKPGPFVLRAGLPLARVPRSDGWVALRFATPPGAGPDDPSTGLIVRELGLAPAVR
ncbi:MAG: SGNH/GDSL hydrolase family protein [Myxococcota bacterium]